MRSRVVSCGKSKKIFLVGCLPSTRAQKGEGCRCRMGVGVCPDIAFFLIPFGRVDYYSYLCSVLKYILLVAVLFVRMGLPLSINVP